MKHLPFLKRYYEGKTFTSKRYTFVVVRIDSLYQSRDGYMTCVVWYDCPATAVYLFHRELETLRKEMVTFFGVWPLFHRLPS